MAIVSTHLIGFQLSTLSSLLTPTMGSTLSSLLTPLKFIPPNSTDPLVSLLELEKACLFFGKPDYPELPSSGGLFKESSDVRN